MYCCLAKFSFCCRLLFLIPMAICSERVITPVSMSFFCGVMKFSFRGLPLFLGGSTFYFEPTKVGRVAVTVPPSGVGNVTVVTS